MKVNYKGQKKNPVWNFPLFAVLWTKRRRKHEKFENNLMVRCAMPFVWGSSAPSQLSFAVLCLLLQGQTCSSPTAFYSEQHMTHLEHGKLATIAFIYCTGAKGQIKHLNCIQSCPDSTEKVSCPCSSPSCLGQGRLCGFLKVFKRSLCATYIHCALWDCNRTET